MCDCFPLTTMKNHYQRDFQTFMRFNATIRKKCPNICHFLLDLYAPTFRLLDFGK